MSANSMTNVWNFGFTEWPSLHPRIGGTWENALEPFDPVKHPVRFSFRALKPLHDLAGHVEVLIEGVAETAGFKRGTVPA